MATWYVDPVGVAHAMLPAPPQTPTDATQQKRVWYVDPQGVARQTLEREVTQQQTLPRIAKRPTLCVNAARVRRNTVIGVCAALVTLAMVASPILLSWIG